MSDSLPYSIKKKAEKELKKIRQSDKILYQKMIATIESISENPFIGQAKKGDLKGYFCVDINHIRTNYELCYTLEEGDNGVLVLVIIILIGPRENFYEQLKRYLNK